MSALEDVQYIGGISRLHQGNIKSTTEDVKYIGRIQ